MIQTSDVVELQLKKFMNENKSMKMITELKINENECRNRNKCNTSGMKMNAVLMEMKAWIKMYNWIHKSKIFESKIHTQIHAFESYQKEVNGKYLESSDIQHTGHLE